MINNKYTGQAGYGCEDVKPHGFVHLMDLYENNYMRLRRLIPDITRLSDSAVSHLPGCLSLHVSILERSKFTTTLCLTYYFDEGELRIAEPALTIMMPINWKCSLGICNMVVNIMITSLRKR